MTMLQTTSEIDWPVTIAYADSPYQASENEIVLVADLIEPASAVTILLPNRPEDGAIIAVKAAGTDVQDITITATDDGLGSYQDIFCPVDTDGVDLYSTHLNTSAGESVIIRYQFYTGVDAFQGGTWHVIARA